MMSYLMQSTAPTLEEGCLLVSRIPLKRMGIEHIETYSYKCDILSNSNLPIPSVNILSDIDDRSVENTNANGSKDERASCNMVTLATLSTHEGLPFRGGYEEALAVRLAIKHLNDGDGSLIKEVEGLDKKCNIDFNVDTIDTKYNPGETLQSVVKRIESDSLGPPCVFLGAQPSFVTGPVAALVNMYGYPQISSENVAQLTRQSVGRPLLTINFPDDVTTTKAFVWYLKKKKIKHLAVLVVNDQYGLGFLDRLQRQVAIEKDVLDVKPFYLNVDGSNLEETMIDIRNSMYRFILCLQHGTLIRVHTMMKNAVQNNVAGNGKHNWFFIYDLPEELFDSIQNDFSLYKAYHGVGFFGPAGGKPSSNHDSPSLYESFHKQLLALKEDEELISSLVADNGNTSPPTQRNETIQFLLNDESFLDLPSRDMLPYLYESAILAGLTACSTARDGIHLTGKEFNKAVRKNNFQSITGHVRFDANTGRRCDNSTYFSMVNHIGKHYDYFDDSNTSHSEGRFDFEWVTTDVLNEGKWEEIAPFTYSSNSTDLPDAVEPFEEKSEVMSSGFKVFAYVLCTVSVTISIGLAIWTLIHRKERIIRASQPFFLLAICCGTILLAATIIPMTFDVAPSHFMNENGEFYDVSERNCRDWNVIEEEEKQCVEMPQSTDDRMMFACTSIVWLATIGTTIIISALATKTYRINKIMQAAKRFKRVQVRVRDVVWPMVAFWFVNVVILSLLTAFDPVHYDVVAVNFDAFGRPSTSNAYCDFNVYNHSKYFAPIILLNSAVLWFALYQSWLARDLSTEFQESEHIYKAVMVMLVVTFVGMPGVFIARRNLNANLFLGSAVIFVMCISVSLMLFYPKIRYIHGTENQRFTDSKKELIRSKTLVFNASRSSMVPFKPGEKDADGEIIYSAKSRRELIIENNKLKDELKNLEESVQLEEIKEQTSYSDDLLSNSSELE
ncbi:unnamed protein product [Pseudo-nitzschia multistriata]|uniref:G-protein coupled receptors family 3 profile domain-containing protein n=1 Tax=Pseudo-nitzschia multistriata TaxID=183589 RepID=A0A448YY75_9STRA|nr:unnamed protein product [Pseudo-nitzschia multistriata]